MVGVVAFLVVLLGVITYLPIRGSWGHGPDHSVADSVPPELELPDAVSEVAWVWSASNRPNIWEVFPVSFGLVAMTSEGVFALNGQTGEEVWRYAREDVWFRSYSVTPDGKIAAVSFYEGGTEEFEQDEEPLETVILIDIQDGSIVNEYEIPSQSQEEDPEGRALNLVTNEDFVDSRLDGGILYLQASVLSDGQDSWSVEYDLEIEKIVDTLVLGDVILVLGASFDDPDDEELGTASIAGFSAQDGSLLWKEERSYLNVDLDPLILGKAEQERVSVDLNSPEGDRHSWVFDSHSGEVLAEGPGRLVESAVADIVLAETSGEQVRYTWFRKDGSKTESVVDARPVESDSAPEVATGEGVMRLSHLLEGGAGRGPTTLEFVPWDAEADMEFVPLEFNTHEQMQDGETSLFPGRLTPVATLVPGALIVSESEINSTELRGIV